MFEYKYRNFYEVLKNNDEKYGKNIAYFDNERKITFSRLKLKVDTFARFLEFIGVKRGDKVALVVANSPEFVIAFLGAGKLGAVPVPINTFLKEEEIAFIINDCEAKVLVSSSKYAKETRNLPQKTGIEKTIWEGDFEDLDEDNISFAEILSNLESHEKISYEPNIDDIAAIIYTSGTTGKPKGAMLSYKNIFANKPLP